jgi:molecular chaperone Hsp33
MTATNAVDDHIQPFQIERPGLRGRLVRLGPVVDRLLAGHDYPAPVAAMLAEATAMGAVLASGLKYEGIFTLQLQGDGPIGLMVVDITSAGDLRGYARIDAERVPPLAGPEGAVPRLFGSGLMSFTLDQGPHTERHQGITPLEGATLGDCCHAYFRHSEQMQTAIRLCASDMSAPGITGRRAAALMLQRLPPTGPGAAGADAADGGEEDDWRRSVILMSTATPAELLAPERSSADILYRLFHEDGVRVYRQRPLRHRCRCSRTRVERTLRAFPLAELQTLLEEGVLRVTCEFCRAEYTFDEPALQSLMAS